jgi:hypothetical protein
MSKHIFALGGRIVPLAVTTALAVTMAPAAAAPTKVGPVRNLAMTFGQSDNPYVVMSDWDDLAGATAYRVSLTSGGTVLQSDKVTVSDWRATTTLGATTMVTLKVVPMAGKRPGRPTSITEALPDVTAPTGTFTLKQSSPGSRDVTVEQETLVDNVDPADSIVRTIRWDEGMAFQPWNGGTHTYAVDLQAYHPTVKLEDAAGNTRQVPLGTVVVGDHTAPTGTFGVTSSSGWAGWTRISLTETTPVEDAVSVDGRVTRTVDWGDGTQNTWTEGAAPTHVYAADGSYDPKVTLADGAGNESEATMANSVVVTADTGRPTISLVKPATRRTWVRRWVTLHGKARDAATGVRVAKLRLVEKRGATWYAYRGTTGRWVRGGTTEAAALRRTTPAKAKPSAKGTWSYKVRGLRKGRLVVRVQSTDNVKNRSRLLTVRQTLTHS